MQTHKISLKKVSVHNLKEVDLEILSGELIVFTGVSGSGKSSLAFDTLYTEGQRRYIESLSAYARRYMGELVKPDVEEVAGLSPTISIEQKTAGKNPRSIVGTMTETYDYMRVLYARIATPYCPVSGEAVAPQSKEKILKTIQHFPEGTRALILAPLAKGKKGEFKDDFQLFLRRGYLRARVDGNLVDLSEEIALDKNVAHDIDIVIDRLVINRESASRIAEAVMGALEVGGGVMSVFELDSGEETLFSTHAYSPKSGLYYPSLEPHDFSFNSPSGMCPLCHGLGQTQEFDLDLVIDPEKSIAEDACAIASSYKTVRYGNIYNNLAQLYHFDVNTPWKKLREEAKHLFLYGSDKKWIQMHFVHPERGTEWTDYVRWRGALQEARARYQEAKSDGYKKRMEELMVEQQCSECRGARLKPYPAAALLKGRAIHELTRMTIGEALAFFSTLALGEQEKLIGEELIKEICSRLNFLIDVGLHYLTLDRSAATLSGGEAQRVRLASQVGCGLVGVTYVLDEPSIGLHPRDNKKLIATLKRLRDIGNTVVVVEHDEETILAADRVVDFGPGPGRLGGEILVNGGLAELLAHPQSVTGAYLSGKKAIAIPKSRRKAGAGTLSVKGACHNNLKGVDVSFPLGLFIAVTGVSGSGKSSLVSDTLFPALANKLHHAEHRVGKHKEIKGIEGIDKVIAIDQSPIGRNPRSNPATYIKIFDEIRQLFAKLPESVARGYGAGRFSFNVHDGSCAQCQGIGMIRVDMDFMDDQWVTCPTCKARRFDHETLSILYKGKSIYDVLEMTVDEALAFFQNIPALSRKLAVLAKVGMEYITLGQPSTTLSGGEAQRIKLAKELVRPASGRTFYILDEPTTGLHFHDIGALLKVLQELTARGNTVLVIEHNMDVVKMADWIIDMGPEGGSAGGQVVAEGTPEKVAKLKTPTGSALKEVLERAPITAQKQPPREAQPVSKIAIRGAEQNNLKHLDLDIPRGKLTICTGPSGSGKSSLAFETVYAEGQRRYIESLSPYARQFVRQMPKPKLSQIEGLSPAIAIEQKASSGNARSTVGTLTEIYDYLRILFARAGTAFCPETGEEIRSITKETVVEQILAYPEGEKIALLAPFELKKGEVFEEVQRRLAGQGYLRLRLNGEIFELDGPIPFDRRRKNQMALVVDRLKVSPKIESRVYEALENILHISESEVIVEKEGGDVFFNLAFAVASTGRSYPAITPHTFSFNRADGMCLECQGLGFQYGANFVARHEVMQQSLISLLSNLWTHTYLPALDAFLAAEGIDPYLPLHQIEKSQLKTLLNGSDGWIAVKGGYRVRWMGLGPTLVKAAKSARKEVRQTLIPLLDEVVCPFCQGTRLHPLARNVRIHDHSIASLCKLPVKHSLAFLKTLAVPKLLEEAMQQLLARLAFLVEVGLGYMSLDRPARTLSNGEAQRIRLARQLGSSLTGVLYVLDEPTIGLHPHDNARLSSALQKLKQLGNTLLLVEHDPQTLETADHLIDFGPGAGIHGGHIIAQGSYEELLKDPKSLTGAYLSGRAEIPRPKKRRKADGWLDIPPTSKHNLKHFEARIPKRALTCLTGISGSGKSTLMHEVIRPHFEQKVKSEEPFNKLIVIDQDPIGHTSRSDVGTYVEVLPVLRTFFASLALSRTKGLLPAHFSYNHKKGMCTSCWGMGYRKVEMHFLPPIRVTCEQCGGLRLNPVSLEVVYQGRNFGQLLDATVEEARLLFEILPKARRIFDTLISVGLGYLKLGQQMATLSGGEAQRMKLARELARRGTGNTLYLLDEPTTGLHPDDILKLLSVLHRLVDKGNTMVLIEHNIDMIKNADYILDLGPEAGEGGGHLVCAGTPEEVAKHPTSYTAKYLVT